MRFCEPDNRDYFGNRYARVSNFPDLHELGLSQNSSGSINSSDSNPTHQCDIVHHYELFPGDEVENSAGSHSNLEYIKPLIGFCVIFIAFDLLE